MALSVKERDKLKVLHEVEQAHLKQREGAAQLGMSDRGFRKLLKRYRTKKDGAVIHALRGRGSNRRLKEETTRKVLECFRERYRDFGPTLSAEYLEKEVQIKLSRETLRKMLIKEGLWKAKPRKIREVHVWRPRRSCCGELTQWDTSVHAWLEERGPARMYLIALIDDATSRLFARFVPADSTEHHMRVLWAYVERYGRPQAVYTDRAGLFSRRWRRAGERKNRGRRRRHRWGEHSGSWASSGSQHTRHRPKGGSSAASGHYRTGW